MEEKESGYFKLGEALDDVNHAYGAKDKAVATLKLFGKGVFNVGRFAVAEALPAALEHASNAVANNAKATDEQREKARESKEFAAQMRENYKPKQNNE